MLEIISDYDILKYSKSPCSPHYSLKIQVNQSAGRDLEENDREIERVRLRKRERRERMIIFSVKLAKIK